MNPGSHNQIWELVKYLLYEHDCVIIPSFGGFVCNREPARIDQVSHILLPPGKRLVFNQNLRSNDGLLAGKLAEKSSISYAEAILKIEELVVHVQEILTEKKQLTIDAFGSFRLNAEANYVFLPDKQNSYLTSSFGLKPLQADHLKGGPFKERRTRIFKEREIVVHPKHKSRAGVWPKVLVGVLTLMLVVNGWIYLRVTPEAGDHIRNASLNVTAWFDSIFHSEEKAEPVKTVAAVEETPIARNPAIDLVPQEPLTTEKEVSMDTVSGPTVQEPIAETPSVPVESTEDNRLILFGQNLAAARGNAFFIPTIPASEPEVTDAKPTPDQPVWNESGPYFIIGGVFCKQGNAEHFRDALISKGYNAQLMVNHSINCQRVSYASFSTREEAETKLREIQSTENPDAWILVEKNAR